MLLHELPLGEGRRRTIAGAPIAPIAAVPAPTPADDDDDDMMMMMMK